MNRSTYDLDAISKKLRKYLDSSRYEHTQGVRYMCAALAMAHGVDAYKAEVAGLLHDCAKNVPDDKKIKICDKYGIAISEVERANPFLLHAKVGGFIARKKYDIEDQSIIDAIICHTTGKEAMNPLEQIVFIADYIEPHRNKSEHLPLIRKMAFGDLNECCYLILKDMLFYLHSRSGQIDDTTMKAFKFYEEVHLESVD